jgi:hypothetical protein
MRTLKIFSWIVGLAFAGGVIFLLGPFVFAGFGLTGGSLDWRKTMSDADPTLEDVQIATPVRTLRTQCQLPQLMNNVPIYAATLREGDIETAMQEFGTRAAQVDVLITETKTPVALILAARNAVIWNLRLAKGAKVAAVITTGFDRQVVVSKQTSVGVLPATISDEECNGFLRRAEGLQMLEPLTKDELLEVSKKAFGRAPTEIVAANKASELIFGPEEAAAQVPASTDPFVVPDTLVDHRRPVLFGRPALQRLVNEGVLAQATGEDVSRWQSYGSLSQDPPSYIKSLDLSRTFVIRRHFQMPPGVNGLASSAFIIPAGGQKPKAWSIAENVYLLSAPFGCEHYWGWYENCGKTLSTTFKPASRERLKTAEPLKSTQ